MGFMYPYVSHVLTIAMLQKSWTCHCSTLNKGSTKKSTQKKHCWHLFARHPSTKSRKTRANAHEAEGYLLHPWNLRKFLKKCHSKSHSTVATASFDGSAPGISCCPEPPGQNLHFRSHATVDAWAGTPVAHTEQDLEFMSNEMGRMHFLEQNCILEIVFLVASTFPESCCIAMAQQSGKSSKLFHEIQLNTPGKCP